MDKLGENIVTFLKKYRYAALIVLVGMFLMLLPEANERETTEQADVPSVQTREPDTEEKLSAILSQIQGAGKVAVMLTEASGEKTIYQTDEDNSSDSDSSTKRQSTITITDAERNETGLIQQVDPPVYLGAIIVCQGADSPTVRLAIVEAVSAVTGLGADRISVLKMK